MGDGPTLADLAAETKAADAAPRRGPGRPPGAKNKNPKNDGPPRPPGRPTNAAKRADRIRTSIEAPATAVAVAAELRGATLVAQDAAVFVEYAPELAAAIERLCERNPKIAAAVERLLSSSEWGELVWLVLQIGQRIYANHQAAAENNPDAPGLRVVSP